MNITYCDLCGNVMPESDHIIKFAAGNHPATCIATDQTTTVTMLIICENCYNVALEPLIEKRAAVRKRLQG